jgi:hypothetical protein
MVTRADIEAEAEFIMGLIQKAREQAMPFVVYAPKNTIFINEIWAFVSVDPEDGYEGVLSAPLMGPGSQVPLIAADVKRLEGLWPIARKMAAITGRKCKLVRFHNREEIEEF